MEQSIYREQWTYLFERNIASLRDKIIGNLTNTLLIIYEEKKYSWYEQKYSWYEEKNTLDNIWKKNTLEIIYEKKKYQWTYLFERNIDEENTLLQ